MTNPLVLQIPIPLCNEHIKSHNNKPFGVLTCKGWYYIAIPTILGSTICRECRNELFIPMPFLYSANLSSANLSSADLSSANLYSANLSSANLSSARNLKECYNLGKAYWNKFTQIDKEFKDLLSKDRFVEWNTNAITKAVVLVMLQGMSGRGTRQVSIMLNVLCVKRIFQEMRQ